MTEQCTANRTRIVMEEYIGARQRGALMIDRGSIDPLWAPHNLVIWQLIVQGVGVIRSSIIHVCVIEGTYSGRIAREAVEACHINKAGSTCISAPSLALLGRRPPSSMTSISERNCCGVSTCVIWILLLVSGRLGGGAPLFGRV